MIENIPQKGKLLRFIYIFAMPDEVFVDYFLQH